MTNEEKVLRILCTRPREDIDSDTIAQLTDLKREQVRTAVRRIITTGKPENHNPPGVINTVHTGRIWKWFPLDVRDTSTRPPRRPTTSTRATRATTTDPPKSSLSSVIYELVFRDNDILVLKSDAGTRIVVQVIKEMEQ